jgi:cytochrome c
MGRRGLVLSCALVLCSLLFVSTARAQGTAPPETDFQVTTLAKGSDKTGEPIAMAVLPDRRVLHTSRDGRVWVTTPSATTSLAGTIPVYSHDEDGLQGIAIDPDFATNRWVYLYYAPPLSTPAGDAPGSGSGPAAFAPFKGYNQLSRMQLTEAGTLDRSTEQKILQVGTDRGICCHAGGEIDFDAQGNLYLSTGDDTNPFESDGYSPIDERSTRNPAFDAQRSSANTNDLRGKLLRIKVNQDGSYSVPAGNLFAPGQMGTRPEIYAMGFRNPFRFAVDQATGWVYLGDYGPDAGGPNANRGPGGQVEFNLIKGAGNYGWPYCHGKNDAYNDFDFATGISGPKFNCAAPKNTSPNNTGLVDLPPAQPAWIAYDGASVPEFGNGSESPMGGETYHFDAANPSTTKFPAYYDGKNFPYEFGRSWIKALTVGPDGSLLGIEPFLDGFDFKQLINTEFGPDGSLYVLDYGTGFFSGDAFSAVYRIDYVQGTRSPVAEVAADRTSGPAPLTVKFSSDGSRDPDGGAIAYAWDLDGDGTTDSTAANPSHTYTAAGKYTAALTVTDPSGQTARASVNIVAGNTAPQVTITVPPDGGIFEYGDTIHFTIAVTDAEDGAIDCAKVRLDTALGHNEHSHGDQNLTGCSGELTIPAAWEDKTQHSFYVLTASYTDSGAASPGLELTGTNQVVLEHRTQQAEFFDGQSGLQVVGHSAAAGGQRVGYVDAGDWLRFDDVNLSGIDAVAARVTSTGTSGLELRADSPIGQLLASIPVPNAGSVDNYQTLPSVPVADPGGTHDLYVVFTAANMDLDEFTFQGSGVAGNANPVLDASADPTSGSVPLKVDFSATATDPEGTAVSLVWDFGVAGAPKPTTSTASYTYAQRGRYTASVTATDADGRKSVRTFAIEANAQCGDTATDEFDGTALDTGVWSRIIRPDTSAYRVQNGALVIDAVAGDMYGGNTSAKNIIGQPAPDGAWTATTKVTLDHAGTWEQAGMLLHASDQNFLKLSFIQTPDGRNIEFIRQRNGSPDDHGAAERSPTFAPDASDTVFLRMGSDGAAVTAAYSANGTDWTPVGRSQPLDALTDPVIGVSAFNGVGTPASFDSFSLSAGGTKGGTPDEFDGSELDVCRWSTILREDAAHYRVAGGKLEIDALDGDMYGGSTSAKNVILQDAPKGGWEAVTKVAVPQGEDFEQGGLMVHSTDRNFAKLVLMDIPGQGWRVEFGQNVDGQPSFDETLDRSGALPAAINDTGIYLKLRSNGSSLAAAWSVDGSTWTPLGRQRSLALMPDPRVGLAAYNGNGQAATFDFFHLDAVAVEPTCQTGATPDAGYRMLFDGTAASLAQWRMSGPGGFTLQADCSILSYGGLGLLYHPDSFGSYSLKLDWKMAGDDNAGVFVGFKNPGNDPFNAVNQGHEIQIDATDDPTHTTGSIYGFKAADIAARDAALKPPGQWNAYEIVVDGDRIQVFLNGSKINDYTDTDPNRMNAPSLIGLQNHGNGDDVFFRNVQIREGLPSGGAPTVEAFADPASGSAPLHVNFSASGLDPDGGEIAEYKWEFADGVAYGDGVSRTYTKAGTYAAKVTVTDDEGDTASKVVTVTVSGSGNVPPEIVQATADRTSGAAPLSTLFQAVAHDAEGDLLTYAWEFGDGGTAFGEEAEHTYLTKGAYEAKLTVTDAAGGSDTATIAIAVSDPPGNRAPSVAAAAVPQSGKAPLDVQLSAQGTDPDGDALTYAWDFGDGSPGAAGRRARHLYTANGVFTAKVTATDGGGKTATATVKITVGNPAGNQAPTVQAAADPASGTAPLKVNFSASANDPDGDQVTYVWDFGDGAQAGGAKVTHTYSAPGTYTAKVTVADAGGKSGTATLTITVAAPVRVAGGSTPPPVPAPAPQPKPAVKTVLQALAAPSPAAFRTRGLRVAAACGADGSGTVGLRATKATAHKLRLSSRVLGRTTMACVAGKTVSVTVKPSKKVRRAIRAKKPKSLTITVALALQTGAPLQRTITLR